MNHVRRRSYSCLRHANSCVRLTARQRNKAHAGKRYGIARIKRQGLLIAQRNLAQTRSERRRLLGMPLLPLRLSLYLHNHGTSPMFLLARYGVSVGDSRTITSFVIRELQMFPECERVLIWES
jgi:hypothetical protein